MYKHKHNYNIIVELKLGLMMFIQWQQSGGTCASAPFVCGYNNAPQNNWMVTQHISREDLVEAVHETYKFIHIMIDLTLDIPCSQNLPSCVNDLSLYVWETSTQNEISAADTHNYRFIANISSGIQYLTVDFSSSQHSGFYLGIRDNGTCMIVNHVLVYIGCRAATVGLVRVSESVFTSSSATVLGECVADSEPINETGPLLECSERGEWIVVSDCQCTAHHYLDSSGLLCLSSEIYFYFTYMFMGYPILHSITLSTQSFHRLHRV